MGDLRLIASAYPGKCRVCGKPHDKGAQVWWRKGEKGVVCGVCKPNQAPDPVLPTPSPVPSPYDLPSPPTAKAELPPDSGDGNRHTVRKWGSWAEYLDTASKTKPIEGEGCWFSSKTKFYGTDSWDEALRLGRDGWDAVRPQVDALVEKLEDKIIPSLRPAFTSYFDVSGGMVDVGRFLDGEPECMVETKLVEIAKPGRVISILVNGGVLSVASTAEIIERGCAIVALVDALEKMQYGTEIWMEKSSGAVFGATPANANVLTHLIKLKDAGEGIDINMLMFAIANPAAHRRVTFAIRRNEPNMRRFGIPHESTAPLTCGERVGAAITLESLSHKGRTISAQEWVETRLSEFGLLAEKGE